MRVAALYDVHGNATALEAVLAEVDAEAVDAIVSGGDVVWGPEQSECIGLLRAAGARFVAGNCERELLEGGAETAAWCRERLTSEDRAFVSTWPDRIELVVEDLGRVLYCHASPRSDEENLTRGMADDDLAAALAGVDADVVVVGHTHVQLDRHLAAGPRLVNAGSVGLPCQGEVGAFWALLGPDVELRRTQYDVERALEHLRASGFPQAGAFEDLIRGDAVAESTTAYFKSKRRAT